MRLCTGSKTGLPKSKASSRRPERMRSWSTRMDSKTSLIGSRAHTTSVSRSRMRHPLSSSLPCANARFLFHSDAAVISTHPRDIPLVVRRQDTTRKDTRERRKKRKEAALAQKKEEVKRMKALKMKEFHQKIEKIGREG